MVAGYGQAFASVYRRHLPVVVAFLLRETGDREATADLTAEVFAAVFLVARRFRARGPGVTFDFTASGRRAFQRVTAEIARRGALLSGLGQQLNQHFAVALDNHLITVPFIDFKQYPDGINGDLGADIAGNLTFRGAKDLALLLRYGPLPVNLTATG